MDSNRSKLNPKLRRPPDIEVNLSDGHDLLGSPYSNNSSPRLLAGSPLTPRQLMPPTPTGLGLYRDARSPSSSSEMLIPPSRSLVRTPRVTDSPLASPMGSAFSSRRSSLTSEAGNSARGPFTSLLDDSRAPSRSGSDSEYVNTQTVAWRYNIMPSEGLLLYPEDVEKDDYMHNPDPNERETRDRCDIFNRRGAMNIGGLVILTIGLLFLFVGYPALTFGRDVIESSIPRLNNGSCASDNNCLSDSVPLLKNVRTGLIDKDTPTSAYTKTAQDGTVLKLVFSDEFNTDGRTFYQGDDPYFQAVDIWYGATGDLEWYDPDAITTANGTLNIKFDAFQSHNLNYRSGMLQSWNQLCFKGGRVEASLSLPGRGDIEGFWPGFWIMGNLGRPGYTATTEGLWPYSYWDKCDAGITPNQSAPDGISLLPGMRLPACTCKNQDHPSPGSSRSAPEIDALEASVGFMGPGPYGGATGSASQSFQAAPFDVWYQPDYNYVELYDNSITGMNSYRGGPYQEAISGVTWLNNDWYDGKGYQTYGFEYTPGTSGDLVWFVGDDYTWKLDPRAIRPNGNIGQRVLPEEPMALVMNFGMSDSFAQIFMANIAPLLPATMRFDYVRIYQDADSESVTCDPPGYPTTDYIAQHPKAYDNPNLTSWASTGYEWPKNTLMNGCT